MRHIRILLVAMALFLIPYPVPPASANTGIGIGNYTFSDSDGSSCSADGVFTISAEPGVGGGIGGEPLPCFFYPDTYTADQCFAFGGGIECTYSTGGRYSSLVVYNSAEFVYLYVYPDGASDFVVGSLLV